jgi:hypothetical protein
MRCNRFVLSPALSLAFLIVFCSLTSAAVADSLPLTLKLWSLQDAQSITCNGKSWVEVTPGKLQRTAVIVSPSKPNLISHDERVLACDDGSGKDAPITGAIAQTRVVHVGQTVLQGTLRVIALRTQSKPGTISTIVFAVNTIAGDMALMSQSGKGMIRLDHASGIRVYPPSYEVDRVMESTIYEVQEAPPKLLAPCAISYFADDPEVPPKVVRSRLDCGSLVQQTDSNAIFSGDIPGKL